MSKKTFVVTMKRRSAGIYTVAADHVEMHDEHLVFVDSAGDMAGLFLLSDVESWVELPDTQDPKE